MLVRPRAVAGLVAVVAVAAALTAVPASSFADTPAPVASTVTTSATSYTYGHPGQVDATITPASATGTVELLDGTVVIGTASAVDGAATVTIPGTSLTAGEHTLTLAYDGDAATLASTTTVGVSVSPAASGLSIDLSSGTLEVFRGGTTATATVVASGATPTGSVDVFVGGSLVQTVALTNGSASVDLGPFTTVGFVPVEVRYAGDGNVLASSGQTGVSVVRQQPSISLSASPSVIKVHKTKAQVTVTLSADGFNPTGPVTLSSGGSSWTATLMGGSATFSLPGFKQTGDQTLWVSYLGDELAESASRSFVVTVIK
jgi:hypothetical protein